MSLLIIIITVLIIFFLLSAGFIKKLSPNHTKQPPGPWNLPFIGSLHHLLRPQPPQQILRDLSTTHGPIMRLKLGEIPAVIISSSAAAKQILKTHDMAFASRPIPPSFNAICYGGKDIAFAPYDDFWRQMRRLCLLELFSPKRIHSFRYIREEETSNLIKSIAAAAAAGVSVNLSGGVSRLTNNITARAVVGGKTADQKEFQSAVAVVMGLASGFNVADLFPSMPFIARITGLQGRLDECQGKLDRINESIIEEHKNKSAKLFAAEDIIDVLLRIQAEDNLQFPLTNDHIKAITNDLLLAGTDTAATAIVWAMSELIRNPKIKLKAQREVREAFDRATPCMVAEEELMSGDKLSYLRLVIKETLRMHPPIPLLLPRENQERREVMGFDIPAKTMVMVNVWAIGRDSNDWDEPDAFQPERFEGSEVDFKGGHMELIPFGAGRRICPGISFGLANIEIALAHMLYYFDWEYLTNGGEELDMTEALGVATGRKFPLCLLPVQHIPLPA